jgi:hypothetical protein
MRKRERLIDRKSEKASVSITRTGYPHGDAVAAGQIHALHALGEHELVDCACRREGKERENEKMRNEEACGWRKRISLKVLSLSLSLSLTFQVPVAAQIQHP